MKKLTIALLICALLISPLFAVSAQSCTSYIYVEGSELCSGQTIQLIFAADCDMVSGLSAEITLSDNLTLLGGKGLYDGWDFEIAGNNIVMYDINGEAPASGENEFFELTVKVNSNCVEGDEVYAEISASLATVSEGYKTVTTAAAFDTVLQECRHYVTAWQVVTPPSGGNPGVKAEVCVSCGEVLRQEEISFLPGDTDLNGTVNVMDAIVISKYVSYVSDITDTQKLIGDVNGTGVTDIIDAALIARYSANLIDKFPIE